MTIPARRDNPTGLHQRYIITKASGEPVDPGALYFVLRIDDGGNSLTHSEACREAARDYCRYIFRYPKTHELYPVAQDLWNLLNEIEAQEL